MSLIDLNRAITIIDDVQDLIHAGFMAAGNLDDGDDRNALKTVLHIAGERLREATQHVSVAHREQASKKGEDAMLQALKGQRK